MARISPPRKGVLSALAIEDAFYRVDHSFAETPYYHA